MFYSHDLVFLQTIGDARFVEVLIIVTYIYVTMFAEVVVILNVI